MINIHGPDRIVAGVDARGGKIATKGWLEDSGLDYLEFIDQLHQLGIRYIVATDIIRDGTLTSPNWDMYEAIAAKIKDVNVVVSGGVSCDADIERAGAYYGVIVGKAYYEGKVDLEKWLKSE
jgi:phosphoribosylformimino-5-aminoimidazole carboxamide ribotide isomerase